MRARSIKPGLFKNEVLGSADPLLTILFEGLWCMADREGRLEDRPLRITAEVFPYRRSITDRKCSAMLDWLVAHGFIVRYKHSGCSFIQVANFRAHQNPHKNEAPSKIPALSSTEHCASTAQAPERDAPHTERLGLTPDSGLLTPDSGLLTQDSPRSPEAEPAPGLFADAAQAMSAINHAYPDSLSPDADWLVAEHHCRVLVEAGQATWESLLGAARQYRQQAEAAGRIPNHVTSPARFFGSPKWRGPFPMPVTKAQQTQDANVAVAQEWLRANQ